MNARSHQTGDIEPAGKIRFRVWDSTPGYEFMTATVSLEDVENGFNVTGKNRTVMQFTGLTDRNGVEIYEGDILRLYGGHLATVKWYDDGCMFVGWHAEIFQHSAEQYLDTADVKTVRKQWSRAEVIGNVYENPELLPPQETA